MKGAGSTLLVPLIVGCAQFMLQFDSTVIATALPSMAQSLHESPLRLNTAITSYLLSLAIFVPISGWMADRFGARTIFASAIALFAIASGVCGTSQSLPVLVLARVAQGMGGAMMTPVGRTFIAKTVPRESLVKAMQLVSMPAILGPVLGPSVGGFITTYWSWRWIFFINIPIGLVGITLVLIFIGNLKEESPPPFDLRGFLLSGFCLGTLMSAFETMGRGVLPPVVIASFLIVGIGCAALYLLHARRREAPIIDLGLLRFRTFAIAVGGGALFYIGVGALPFLISLMFQVAFGLTAFHAGLITLPLAAGGLASRATMGRNLRAWGFRRTLIGAAVITSLMIACIGFFRESTPLILMVLVMFPIGLFRSLQFNTLTTLAYAGLPTGLMGRATSFSSMAQQLCTSIGVGLGAIILQVTQSIVGAPRLAPRDFTPGFVIMGVLGLIAAFIFSRLPRDAGAEMAGR